MSIHSLRKACSNTLSTKEKVEYKWLKLMMLTQQMRTMLMLVSLHLRRQEQQQESKGDSSLRHCKKMVRTSFQMLELFGYQIGFQKVWLLIQEQELQNKTLKEIVWPVLLLSYEVQQVQDYTLSLQDKVMTIQLNLKVKSFERPPKRN
jgi:hypothetical protein